MSIESASAELKPPRAPLAVVAAPVVQPSAGPMVANSSFTACLMNEMRQQFSNTLQLGDVVDVEPVKEPRRRNKSTKQSPDDEPLFAVPVAPPAPFKPFVDEQQAFSVFTDENAPIATQGGKAVEKPETTRRPLQPLPPPPVEPSATGPSTPEVSLFAPSGASPTLARLNVPCTERQTSTPGRSAPPPRFSLAFGNLGDLTMDAPTAVLPARQHWQQQDDDKQASNSAPEQMDTQQPSPIFAVAQPVSGVDYPHHDVRQAESPADGRLSAIAEASNELHGRSVTSSSGTASSLGGSAHRKRYLPQSPLSNGKQPHHAAILTPAAMVRPRLVICQPMTRLQPPINENTSKTDSPEDSVPLAGVARRLSLDATAPIDVDTDAAVEKTGVGHESLQLVIVA